MQPVIVIGVFAASLGYWVWQIIKRVKGRSACEKGCCGGGEECKSKKV